MPEKDLEKDQTTRPSQRKGPPVAPPSSTSRQPIYDPNGTPAPASDDPTQ